MTDILLDTHVWIWLAVEKKAALSRKARAALEGPSKRWISAITCWELAKLVEKKRITLAIPTLTWINRALNECRVSLAALSPEIAAESTLLPGFHNDPADQIIVATSRVLGMPILTSDRRIRDFAEAETIW